MNPVSPKRLALRELEACACALLTVLLALLDASVASDQAIGLERLAKFNVEYHQGAGDAQLDRVSLCAYAAAANRGYHVEIRRGLSKHQGTLGGNPLLLGHEVNVERLAVDDEAAVAGTQEHASDG